MKKFKNNRTDTDCGVTALENVRHLAGKKRAKASPRKAGATKKGGVIHFKKYQKSVKKIPEVVEVKTKSRPKAKDIKAHLMKDKPSGKTQNVSIIHTKKKSGKKLTDSHLSLAYEAKKNKIKIANWKDEEKVSVVSLKDLQKNYRIERAYNIKVKKKKKK